METNVGYFQVTDRKAESSVCTVHFNSILQSLIYKPQECINKTLIKLKFVNE